MPAGDPPPVPWQPELLSELINELLEAAEDGCVAMYVGKCEAAGLMPKVIEEIERDARFPKVAKIMLKRSLPRLACKWLNASGVSAEYQVELELVTAMLLLIQHQRKVVSKLDELIAKLKPVEPKPATPAAPAANP